MSQEKYIIPSAAALARRIGRNRSTVCRWLRRDDWPVERVPPWDADELGIIEDWMAGLQENRNEPDEQGCEAAWRCLEEFWGDSRETLIRDTMKWLKESAAEIPSELMLELSRQRIIRGLEKQIESTKVDMRRRADETEEMI